MGCTRVNMRIFPVHLIIPCEVLHFLYELVYKNLKNVNSHIEIVILGIKNLNYLKKTYILNNINIELDKYCCQILVL